MTLTVIIPHYRVGKMLAYCISQLLKYEGNDLLKIVVVDNRPSDGSFEKYIIGELRERVLYVPYPEHILQSHGVAINHALELDYVDTEHFLCLENDAYPVGEFVPYYEALIKNGFDAAGSILSLSGGRYLHPCGALYRKSVWAECKAYCDAIPYNYYPSLMLRDNFAMHTMIHKSISDQVEENPEDWMEVSSDYKDRAKEKMEDKRKYYEAVCCPFHDGRGGRQESVKTYGSRADETDVPFIILNDKSQKIIGRCGYEPGQMFYYWMKAMGKKIFEIPTDVKWMPGRENQQQEYTLTESNIRHLWGISSYTERAAVGVEDIYAEKHGLPDKLYNSLPKHQRID